jgi:hypothetical protein
MTPSEAAVGRRSEIARVRCLVPQPGERAERRRLLPVVQIDNSTRSVAR